MKITRWDWCLCLYMTFTALHFISHSAPLSPFCLLFHLPSIIPCRSEWGREGDRERGGEKRGKREREKKKSHSACLQTRCPGTGSQRGEGCFTVTLKGKRSRSKRVKPWWHFASTLHNRSLPSSAPLLMHHLNGDPVLWMKLIPGVRYERMRYD